MALRVGIAAGLVLLADDDDAVRPASEPRACRSRRLLGGDEHPGGGRTAESCCETIGTARAGASEESAGVDERQQRGDHRVVGAHEPWSVSTTTWSERSRTRVARLCSWTAPPPAMIDDANAVQ